MEIAPIKTRVEDINRKRTTYGITDNTTTERTEEICGPRRIFWHMDQPIIVGIETQVEELIRRYVIA